MDEIDISDINNINDGIKITGSNENTLPVLEMSTDFQKILKKHIKDSSFKIKDTTLSEESKKIRLLAIENRIKSECSGIFDSIRVSINKSREENIKLTTRGLRTVHPPISFELPARIIDLGIDIRKFPELGIPDYYMTCDYFYNEINDYHHWLYTYEIYEYAEKELERNGFKITLDSITFDNKFLIFITEFPVL